jgi:hypothetical protein
MGERCFDIPGPLEYIFILEGKKMTVHKWRADERLSEREKDQPAGTKTEENSCRCKETAEMTPRELLRRMINDLVFWKKEKNGQDR